MVSLIASTRRYASAKPTAFVHDCAEVPQLHKSALIKYRQLQAPTGKRNAAAHCHTGGGDVGDQSASYMYV